MKRETALLAVAGLLLALAPTAQAALVGHWSFDDTLDDASAYGNHGIFQGAPDTNPTYSEDVSAILGAGKSIDFQAFNDGDNNEAVKVLNSDSLQFDQAFTVSFWVKGTADELNGYIMGKGINWRNDREYGFDVRKRNNGAQHQFFSLNSKIDGVEPPIVNMWGDPFDTGDAEDWVLATHVTEIRGDSVERDMYINGEYVSTYNNGQPAPPDLNGSTDFWMGGRNISDGITGLLDEVKIWDEALDATAIAALYSPSNDPTDFNQDGNSDLVDLDALTASADLSAGLPAALAGPEFDLTGDETVNSADLDKWLTDAATVNGFGGPYLKGDTNLDGDVDVWAFDGTGDAQVLSSNLGTMTGMVWGDGDFNGDGDVDVWAFDGSGDAQQLSSNLGATNDATAGTAEAIYNAVTGELSFDIGEGVAVVGIMAAGMKHDAVDESSPLGAPVQNGNNILAYFDASGLPAGMSSVGAVLPTGLTDHQMLSFSYTPVGHDTRIVPVTIIVPEPSTITLLLVVGAMALCWRRRA